METYRERAVTEWTDLLGNGAVVTDAAELGPYRRSTTGVSRRVDVALRPRSKFEVAGVLSIANKHRVCVYPISRGRNWGFGSANPVQEDCAVIDLSRMNRIVSFEDQLGLATIEPGVTCGQLSEFLAEHEAPFLVPAHGGGTGCSVLGNALERGYGLTPHCDHFGALTAVEAVLADGTVYESPLAGLGVPKPQLGFKWGLGPYVDGVFSQGNLGIVTQGTFALRHNDDDVDVFFCRFPHDSSLEAAVLTGRQLLRNLPGIVPGVNLVDALRVLAMTVPYPADLQPGSTVPETEITRLAHKNNCPAWVCMGAIYGESGVKRVARRVVKRVARRHGARVTLLGRKRLRQASVLIRCLPRRFRLPLEKQIEAADAFLRIAAGKPNDFALSLPYWGRNSARGTDSVSPAEDSPDPTRDGCGLIWYTPLVPMVPEMVRRYVDLVRRTCREHAVDPMITLTSLSDKCLDSTVPILFDLNDPAAVSRAQACYQSLLTAGRAEGMVPYRIPTHAMTSLFADDASLWSVQTAIKQALDPHGIIAPGRYSVM